jgi:hypothetical protein
MSDSKWQEARTQHGARYWQYDGKDIEVTREPMPDGSQVYRSSTGLQRKARQVFPYAVVTPEFMSLHDRTETAWKRRDAGQRDGKPAHLAFIMVKVSEATENLDKSAGALQSAVRDAAGTTAGLRGTAATLRRKGVTRDDAERLASDIEQVRATRDLLADVYRDALVDARIVLAEARASQL